MGRDLATGHFASPRPSNARPSGLPIVPPNPALIVKNASYSCIAEAPARPAPLPFGPMLWVLPFVSVLCCSVGVYVTWRITRIERVVRHFGSGELATRMSMDSGDAIGQLSRTFNDMADRIQSLVASHQCLCSDMAHELCSPLGRLLLAIPSARRGTGGALDRIEMEANRINHLIEGLLDVARAEADRGSLQVEWVDLESLLAEIVDQCALEAEEKNCEIETDGLCHAGSVAADSEILRRAIENVLRNSLCHTPEGTRIRISTAGDLHSVTICIRDWGPGVPEPAIADIFRPFYRVETSWNRRTGGVGLGLAIAQRAVALHKGNIIAENCSPGLQVKIRLPRNPSLRA